MTGVQTCALPIYFYSYLSSIDHQSSDPRHAAQNAEWSAGKVMSLWAQERPSLATLIDKCSHFGCADPRDRVYGLLGIAADSKSLSLRPNYTKSTVRLYVDVMSRYLAKNRLKKESFGVLTLSAKLQEALGRPFGNPTTSRIPFLGSHHEVKSFQVQLFIKNQVLCVGPSLNPDGALVDKTGDTSWASFEETVIAAFGQHDSSRGGNHMRNTSWSSKPVHTIEESFYKFRIYCQSSLAIDQTGFRIVSLSEDQHSLPAPSNNEAGVTLPHSRDVRGTWERDQWKGVIRTFVTVDGIFGLGPVTVIDGDTLAADFREWQDHRSLLVVRNQKETWTSRARALGTAVFPSEFLQQPRDSFAQKYGCKFGIECVEQMR